MTPDERRAQAARLRERVRRGPDPEAAVRLERFLEAAGLAKGAGPWPAAACTLAPGDPEELLLLLLGQSPALARGLVRDPAALDRLAASPWLRRERGLDSMRVELGRRLATHPEPLAALRRFRTAEYLRLGARELGLGTPAEVGRELAALAAACLDQAVAVALAEVEARLGPPLTEEGRRCRFVAMGMGKLGGEELNFSSDIDLIYLYETDAGAAGGAPLHQFFTRVAERATALLVEPTADGSCFRVDLRLRPEGTRGALCNSLDAAERYYESWGRPWERQAWIKARPVAGDLPLGDEALARLAPMVWPRSGVASAIDDVHALMTRVRAELRDPDDVKLGRGGIREVEFFVQALQLVHGGRRPELRERGTLRALDRLLFGGLVSEREHRLLGDAYVFLRRVEHRLQLAELRQTHALPRDPEELELLGRRLGFDGAAGLRGALFAEREVVAGIYATLGAPASYGHGPEAVAAAMVLVDPASDRAAMEAALGRLGFRDLAGSADEVELLRGKPHGPFSPTAAGATARSAPRLLVDAASSPDPDLALRRLVDLAVRGAPAQVLWRLAGESEAISRLVVSLLGTSEYLARILLAHPELSERLLTAAGADLPALPDAAFHARAIAELLAELDAAGEPATEPTEPTEDDRLDALRRYRNQETLRLGLRDVGGELDVEALGAALTALADALIDATLAIVRPAVEARWGRARTGLAVIGLGKLGGGEMTWSSDLDVLFIFGDDDAAVEGGRGEASAFEVMSRLAQRLLHGLSAQLPSGRLYEVDTRLRPSGRQGALVSSLAGFARYHEERAALWERQALIKARAVAGDRALGAAAVAIAERHVYAPHPDPAWAGEAAQEIARLRGRVAQELPPRPGHHHVKQGRGGLVDIEFLVQYLQLAHGPERPALRLRSTAAALEALRAEGVLSAADHAELAEAHRFLRRLDSRLRIVWDQARAELGGEPHEVDKVARRLGYHGDGAGARLLADYLERAGRVRALLGRLLHAELG